MFKAFGVWPNGKTRMYVCMYACMYVCMYVCIYVCVYSLIVCNRYDNMHFY